MALSTKKTYNNKFDQQQNPLSSARQSNFKALTLKQFNLVLSKITFLN